MLFVTAPRCFPAALVPSANLLRFNQSPDPGGAAVGQPHDLAKERCSCPGWEDPCPAGLSPAEISVLTGNPCSFIF